jgi:hypothetical protein
MNDMQLNPNSKFWQKYHDEFNLFALPLICIINCLYLQYQGIFSILNFIIFLLYIIIDIIWLVLKPESVQSPSTIIYHHIICIFGWFIPIFEPDFSMWISMALLVEINTFFLIAKRFFNHNAILTVLFWFSWVLFRVIMYPLLVYFFYKELLSYYDTHKSKFIIGLIGFILLLILTSLNAKWSVDLVNKFLFRYICNTHYNHQL